MIDRSWIDLLRDGALALHQALPEIVRDLPHVRSAPPETGAYNYHHVSNRGEGETQDEAVAAWRRDLFASLEGHLPDWIVWRQEPRVGVAVDFPTGNAKYCITSEMIFQAKTENAA